MDIVKTSSKTEQASSGQNEESQYKAHLNSETFLLIHFC